MAGQIAELARDTLSRDFRSVDPRTGRILLIEASDRVLTSFPPSLSAKAERSLARLGVTALLGRTVVGVDAEGVTVEDGSGQTERIPARTVIWAAGVMASPLAAKLAERCGAELDRAGRVAVEPDLTLPGPPGGLCAWRHGPRARRRWRATRPPWARAGRDAGGPLRGQRVRARLRGNDAPPFRYRDKGNLATIGRAAAVADIRGLRLSGLIAWLTWLLVHLWYLVGFQNRIVVFIRWSFSFAAHGRGARLITEAEATPSPDEPEA